MGSLREHVRDWRPPKLTARDVLHPGPARALAGLLDAAPPAPGGPLPFLWHWLYFLDWPAQRDLGADGHPAHGPYLPPLPGRRRMWAGGRLTAHGPLRLGAPAERLSEPVAVEVKEGRTGEMVFVTVRHEIVQDGGTRLVEEQDHVYRSAEAPAATPRYTPAPRGTPASSDPWRLPLTAEPTLLFRFSALTANAHRIHYDRPYAREVEGYPDIVVHGPLLAVLMAEPARRAARTIVRMSYRLRRPVFAGDPALVTGGPDGDGARMSVIDAAGETKATAEIGFADA